MKTVNSPFGPIFVWDTGEKIEVADFGRLVAPTIAIEGEEAVSFDAGLEPGRLVPLRDNGRTVLLPPGVHTLPVAIRFITPTAVPAGSRIAIAAKG